jgi:DNA-binding MarR family transcriptional regulator
MLLMLTIDGLELAEGLDQLVTLLPRLTPRGGLSLVAASTLATLERRGPSRITELADARSVTQPAMTGLVSRLVAQALVVRSADPDDRRGVLVALTAEGSALLAARRRERAQALAALLEDLDTADRAALAAALPALNRLVTRGHAMTPPTKTSAPLPAAAMVEDRSA